MIFQKRDLQREAGELALKRIAAENTKLSYHDPNQSSILFLSSVF